MAIKGFDILGLPMQNIRMLKRALPNKCALGVLAGTFGEITRPLSVILDTKKVIAVRAHLMNGPCWRNNRCESSEPNPKDYDVMKKRAAKFQLLAIKYPNIEFFLSPVLEHDERSPAVVKRWLDILKRVAPACRIVQNPHRGIILPGTLTESHGNSLRKDDIRSNDGADIFDAPDAYKNTGKVITFGWTYSFNCLKEGEAWKYPTKRTHKCSEKEIKEIWNLLN